MFWPAAWGLWEIWLGDNTLLRSPLPRNNNCRVSSCCARSHPSGWFSLQTRRHGRVADASHVATSHEKLSWWALWLTQLNPFYSFISKMCIALLQKFLLICWALFAANVKAPASFFQHQEVPVLVQRFPPVQRFFLSFISHVCFHREGEKLIHQFPHKDDCLPKINYYFFKWKFN